MFGIFSAIAVIFVYFNIRETMGLSDKEKKSLYAPKETKEQDYEPIE
jgi:hypothetical protein